MLSLCQGDEEKYSAIPVMTRARYICAQRIQDWVSALDMRDRMKESVHDSQTSPQVPTEIGQILNSGSFGSEEG